MIEPLALLIIVFIVSIIVLYRYGIRLLDYCCIDHKYGRSQSLSISEVFRPPKWSSVLASRITYIDDEVLLFVSDIIRAIGAKLALNYGVNPFEGSLGVPQRVKAVLKLLKYYMDSNGFGKTLLFIKTCIKIKVYRMMLYRLRRHNVVKFRVLASKLYRELRLLEKLVVQRYRG